MSDSIRTDFTAKAATALPFANLAEPDSPSRWLGIEPLLIYPDSYRGPGWFVSVRDECGVLRLISLRFARKLDAQAAVKALIAAGLKDATTLRRAGLKQTLLVMSESMAW